MRKWFVVVASLSAISLSCQSPPEERVRVVPQVSPVKPKRVVYSPVDATRLLVMEGSGLVGIWDIPPGKKPQLFATIPASAIDATFSVDGKHVATVGLDGHVRWWDVDGQLKWVSQGGHGSPARAVAVSPEFIASGGEDGTIRLWRQEGAALGEPLKAHDGPIMSVAISPRGDLVSFGGDEALRLWKRVQSAATPGSVPRFQQPVDLFQPQQRRYPHGLLTFFRRDASWGWDHSVAFSPQGDVIAASLLDGSVRLWNADGSTRAVIADAHRGRQVRALCFSPKGDLLASGGFDGTLRVWNLDGSPHQEAKEVHYHTAFSVAFSPDGTHIATTGRDDFVRIWNIDGSLAFDFPRGYTDRVATVALAGNLPVLAAADQSGDVRLWNLDGSPRGGQLVGHEGSVPALAFSQQDVLASAGSDGTVRLWNLDGKPLSMLTLSGTGGRHLKRINIAFSPRGDALAVGTADFELWKQNRRSWQRLLRSADAIRSIAFSPRGDFIVTGSALGDIQVWNLDGSARTPPMTQDSENIAAVAVARDGEYFAAVWRGSRSVIGLFNLDGQPRGRLLQGDFGHLTALTFSSSGRLVSGGSDGKVRLWTLPSREVDTIDVGLPINQLGYWRDLLWVRAGESVFFYDAQRQLVATMVLRRNAVLAFTPDGWFSGSDRPARFVRLYRDSGESVSDVQIAPRLQPDEVLETLTKAAS